MDLLESGQRLGMRVKQKPTQHYESDALIDVRQLCGRLRGILCAWAGGV
jgi:hypothetical protein